MDLLSQKAKKEQLDLFLETHTLIIHEKMFLEYPLYLYMSESLKNQYDQ